MKEYVLGFVFTSSEILLLRKNKPDFQKNKLNGIGGELEFGEAPEFGMWREWEEETGLDSYNGFKRAFEWNLFAEFGTPVYKVYCFRSQLSDSRYEDILSSLRESNDIGEVFESWEIKYFDNDTFSESKQLMPNLKWLIPLAYDWDTIYTRSHLKL